MRVRMALLALGVLHLMAVVLTAAVGSFADGGGVFARALLVAVHPAAALALVLALARRNPRTGLVVLAVSLALANIAGDAYAAFAIFTGSIRGDAWLPLVFAVFPTISAAYLVARRQ